MKILSLSSLLIIFSFLHANAQKKPEPITSFNKNWEFVKDIDTTNSAQLLSGLNTNNIAWERVSLPHTPQLEPVNKVKEQWQGTCFYRKFFAVPAIDKGKHVAIRFDAAMNDADVYLNGKHLLKHVGGYLPFTIDITNEANYGKQNCIMVKLKNVDNPTIPPGKPIKDLDFNFYGGIYRDAWMIVSDKLYISDAVQANREAAGGILVHDEDVSVNGAKITVKTDVNNDFSQSKKANVKIILTDNEGKVIGTSTSAVQSINGGSFGVFAQSIAVNMPKLWAPSHPYLYKLKVEVLQNGKSVDEQVIRTGIKTIKFEAGAFYINGEKLNIFGTNRHQEYPYIGYAMSDNAQYRDAWKIKDAGFNFVRCSHYPPSPAYLDACDELGIMVMDAIPGWQFFGKEIFQQNSYQNMKDMIHRDRNHASVVLWEASLNETGMSKLFMDKANKIVHDELPFKDVFSTGWEDYAFDVFNPARQHLRAPNYFKKYNHPKPLLLAEYGDWEYYAQNAGFNQKEYAGLKNEERNSRQVRTDGQQRLLQQELNFQEAHNDNLYGPGVGDVNWLMFDYKRGYAADLESSGISDIFRIPKFSFYFYQSQAGPKPDANGFGKPMLFIANYWNDAKQKNIKILSNCDEVELFLNGKSIGIQKPDTDRYSKNLTHPSFTFYPAAYEPGTLTAIGYINGKKTITQNVSTPGDAYKIMLKADISGKALAAGKNDVIFVYAYITDKNGTIVPAASNKLKFTVEGEGSIIGGTEINTEAGIATILLKAGEKPGKVKITATGTGLNGDEFNYVIK
jgi:beta-galactosidase